MNQTIEEKHKALVLDAFDTLFNKRDHAAADKYWSPRYIQHSAHIAPGREGLFNLIKGLPPTLKYEPGTIVAEGDFRWDVIQDEATRKQSKSGLPMFGDHFSK